MIYSELELRKMVNIDLKNLSIDEEIKFNILNFINCIYLNKQNFIHSSYDTEYLGNLSMVFKKKPGQVFGLVRVIVKDEGRKMEYIFNEKGYELLDDIVNC